MADSALSIRTIDREDLSEFGKVFSWAFLTEPADEGEHRWMKVLELDRTHAVFDGDEMVGTGGILSRELTVPGGGQVMRRLPPLGSFGRCLGSAFA